MPQPNNDSKFNRLYQLRNSRESIYLFDGLKKHLTRLFVRKSLDDENYQKDIKQYVDISIQKLISAVNKLPSEYNKALAEEIDKLSSQWEELNEKIATSENIRDVADAVSDIEFPEIVIPKSVTVDNLEAEVKKLSDILQKISQKEIVFPKIQKIEGQVDIGKLPDMPSNAQIIRSLQTIHEAIENIKIPEPKEVRIPKMPKEIGITSSKDILKALDDVKVSLDSLYDKEQPEFPTTVSIDNFPVQKTPTPVTHINILPLNGGVTSRSVTVTTTVTALPPDPAESRRSVIFFNNSSTTTVYIGGADVTPANGIPVLAQSNSPTIDAGVKMDIYGITESGSADIRILEVAMETGRRET